MLTTLIPCKLKKVVRLDIVLDRYLKYYHWVDAPADVGGIINLIPMMEYFSRVKRNLYCVTYILHSHLVSSLRECAKEWGGSGVLVI